MIWVESNGFVLIQFKVVSIHSNHLLKLILNGIVAKEKLKSSINHHQKINPLSLKTVRHLEIPRIRPSHWSNLLTNENPDNSDNLENQFI